METLIFLIVVTVFCPPLGAILSIVFAFNFIVNLFKEG